MKYRNITRTPQSGENANKKMWYATTVTDREVRFEDFVTHVSEPNSPYSRGTAHGALMDTLDCLQELILDGKSVRFADLGLFSIGRTSEGVESKEKVSAASVEGVHLSLRNTKSWSNTELRKKCRIEEYNAYGNTEDTGNTDGDDPNQGGDQNQGGSTQGGGSNTGTEGSGSQGGSQGSGSNPSGGNTEGSGSDDGSYDLK